MELWHSFSLACFLATSKSKLAPLKSVISHRLESTAAVLAVGLLNLIQKEIMTLLEIILFWMLSEVVLYCFRSKTSRFSEFAIS